MSMKGRPARPIASKGVSVSGSLVLSGDVLKVDVREGVSAKNGQPWKMIKVWFLLGTRTFPVLLTKTLAENPPTVGETVAYEVGVQTRVHEGVTYLDWTAYRAAPLPADGDLPARAAG